MRSIVTLTKMCFYASNDKIIFCFTHAVMDNFNEIIVFNVDYSFCVFVLCKRANRLSYK